MGDIKKILEDKQWVVLSQQNGNIQATFENNWIAILRDYLAESMSVTFALLRNNGQVKGFIFYI